jgi:PhzF family phenazine biosynthesis protein
METEIFQIDAFSSRPFHGNPAAVCLPSEPRSPLWMQQVASEMNLSETAFLEPVEGGFGLRWFTPVCEVDLCGHATLASAHFLWEQGVLKSDHPARFHTRSGLLTARISAPGWIEMNFPCQPPDPAVPPAGLDAALGTGFGFCGSNGTDILVEVASEEVVRGLEPDISRLKKVECRGVIVTARAEGKYNFVSRFFAPRAGVDEDPVTGSAHCCLAPYWAARLGKTRFFAYQASHRGGELRVELQQDRVLLSGQAVTVLRGVLTG